MSLNVRGAAPVVPFEEPPTAPVELGLAAEADDEPVLEAEELAELMVELEPVG